MRRSAFTRFFTFFNLVFGLLLLGANTAQAQEVDNTIDNFFAPVSEAIFNVVFYTVDIAGHAVPLVLAWLIAGSVFFTFYLRFINLRGLKHAFKLIRGDYDQPDAPGRITHYQALTTELSGTVGLGNIAGVAIAISLGGPGAAFWMFLTGFFGMSMKFAECSMGVKYRYHDKEGHTHGGPMYYLRDGLKAKGMPLLGEILGALFAIACIGGTMGAIAVFQSNQSYQQLLNVTGGEQGFFGDKGWLFGLVLAFLVGIVILGGIRSIAAVASRIVPFMAAIYIIAGLAIIIVNLPHVPAAFGTIFASAFGADAAIGGFLGAIIAGVQRAAFSNEAGIGSSSIAHSAVKTKRPVTEGFVAMTGPIFDTMLICTITALVIVISGSYADYDGLGGIEITSAAFATVIGWFPYVLTVAVILFAFSTIISWSYYGAKSVNFLFAESRTAEFIYKLIFLCFVIVGSTAELAAAVNFSDAMIFAMSIPNIIGLYILAPVLRKEVKNYLRQVRKEAKELGEVRGKEFA